MFKFHGKIEGVPGFAHVIYMDNVFMIEFAGRAGLIDKAAFEMRVEFFAAEGKHLQGHDAIHGKLLGLIDFPHPPFTDKFDNAVITDPITGMERVRHSITAVLPAVPL